MEGGGGTRNQRLAPRGALDSFRNRESLDEFPLSPLLVPGTRVPAKSERQRPSWNPPRNSLHQRCPTKGGKEFLERVPEGEDSHELAETAVS